MPTESEVKHAAKTLAAARRDKEGITPDKKGSKKSFDNPPPTPSKAKKGWIIGLCAVVALAGIGVGTYFIVKSMQRPDLSKATIQYEESNGGYKVVGVGNENKSLIKTINVPATYNGKPVNEIKEGALGGCAYLEEVTLPFIGKSADATGKEGLFGYVFGKEMSEGAGAFTWQCYDNKEGYQEEDLVYEQAVIPQSLNKVTITGGNKISSGAFSNCKYIQEIEINNDATTIGNYAFYYCSSLFDFKIPSKVTSINKKAFERDYVLQTMELPNTVTTLRSEAFANCISLGLVRIPTSVTKIEHLAFNNLQSALIIVEAATVPSGWDQDWAPETVSISYGTEEVVYGENVLVAICKDAKGERFAYLIQWTGEWQTSTIDIPDTITINGEEYPIRVIGPNIFESNNHLQFVTIGKNVEKIGASAFANCERLEVLNFVRDAKSFEDIKSNHALKYIGPNAFANDEDLYAYQINGDPISGVYIPDSVTDIGMRAFYNCNHIARINISESIVNIGDSAFENCERLMTGYYDDTEQMSDTYPDETFPDAIRINNTIETIGEAAFKNCFRLQDDGQTSILYPTIFIVDDAKINSFNKHVFENCGVYTKSGIYSRQIRVNFDLGKHGADGGRGEGIRKFDDYCLNEAYMNRFRVRNENLEYVGDYAFANARPNMNKLKVCHNVKTIGERAFYNWTTVPEVELENDEDPATQPGGKSKLTSIGAYAFYNMNNPSLDRIYIPNGVEFIGNYAFYNCSNVVELHLPNNPNYHDINFYTFASMKNLGKDGKTLEIPLGIVNVYRAAFQDCSSLTSVKFNNGTNPEDVHIETVSWNIFSNCRALLKVEWDLSYCTSFSSSVFANCQSLVEDGTENLGENTTKSLTLGSSTYSGATSLTSATISKQVRTISTSAFEGCSNLETITINERTLALGIGKYAFRNCKKLETIDLPNCVDSISDQAFANCELLGTVGHDFHLPNRAYNKLTLGIGIFSGLVSSSGETHTIGFYEQGFVKSTTTLYSKIKLEKNTNAVDDTYKVVTTDQTTLDCLGLNAADAAKITFKSLGTK